MSLTLGEKLRQAREERGFTLSEVAEQTRISSLYLESIENDDYRTLPGGIFNKGFVKSYAKFVGLNEQEALLDYSQLLEGSETGQDEGPKLYRPEVLTDDRSSASMAPTIIFAVVILGLMTGGIYLLVNYLRPAASDPAANTATRTNTNTPGGVSANGDTTAPNVPDMATLKVEFKALTAPVSLMATSDGKASSNVVTPGTVATFEPRSNLKLSYSKSLASSVQLTINGKSITLPAVPLNPRRNAIEFEINKDNLAQIWTTGAISTELPAASPPANANIAIPPTPAAPAAATPLPRPAVPANTATPLPRPAETPRAPVPTPTR
jgi:hypothetical protein